MFEELANEIIDKIQSLSKQTDFNNLFYYFKNKNGSENHIGFKGQLGCYKNIRDGYTSPEKAEENKN